MLPDVALLEIFDIYMLGPRLVYEWYWLVHVCRKWRNVIFGSPRRLGLRLYCTAWTPVRETLDAWPPWPIVVWENGYEKWGVDNIIAALEHNDRICRIQFFDIQGAQLESVFKAMQKPFPELTNLLLANGSAGKPTRFVLGRIRTASAITQPDKHFISWITKTTFVCNSPCPTWTFGNS